MLLRMLFRIPQTGPELPAANADLVCRLGAYTLPPSGRFRMSRYVFVQDSNIYINLREMTCTFDNNSDANVPSAKTP